MAASSRPLALGRIILITVLITAPIAGIVGGVSGALFGRRVILGADGNETSVAQTLRVEENSATIEAVEKVGPAVVSIVSSAKSNDPFKFSFQNEVGGGSGFILTADGLIATNRHVVASDDLEYTVVLSDGQTLEAEIVSRDPSYDFAILRVEASGLPVVELGSSDTLKIGERVIAIGNVFGELQNTVTSGVVSARDRTIVASDGAFDAVQLDGLLQTDAAINPGNSGGPLVNLAGQVIGVNTATDVGSQNIGFAIPIDEAKVAIESVIEKGLIERPLLGVRFVNLTRELAELNELDVTEGALINAGQDQRAVVPNSPAQEAGIKEGDIIISINDDKITEQKTLSSILRKYRPEQEIVVVWLADGKERSASVILDTFSE